MAVCMCIYSIYSVHICKYYIRNDLLIKHMFFCALCSTHSPEICCFPAKPASVYNEHKVATLYRLTFPVEVCQDK